MKKTKVKKYCASAFCALVLMFAASCNFGSIAESERTIGGDAVPLDSYPAAKRAAENGTMIYADSSRKGFPYSKDPHVIFFKGRYIMYFSIPPFSDAEKRNLAKGWGIGIAESSDLKNWRKIGERVPEGECEAKGLCAPGAIIRDGMVHLFYQTYGNFPKDAICHAWSSDGVNFTRDASNPIFSPDGRWNNGRAIDAEVVKFNDKYLLYYATRDCGGKIQMLGVASTGAKSSFAKGTWKNISKDAPVLKPQFAWEGKCIEATSAINLDGKIYLFYAGGYNNAPQQIGVASSSDGVVFERLSDKPLLANGKDGEWNSSESGHPHIFRDGGGKLWLFYQGNNNKGKNWFLSKKEVEFKNGRFFITGKN